MKKIGLVKKERIETLDFLRGIAVINMVLYHALFDLEYIFGIDIEFFSIEKSYIWQQFICSTFIFISGFSSQLSEKLIKNGLKILGLALVLSISTYIFMPEFMIKFGILHFLGSAMIITEIFRNIEFKNPEILFFISLLIFIHLKILGLNNFSFYNDLAKYKFLFPLGFYGEDFYSGDYFPILPWIFLFWSGYFLGLVNKKHKNFVSKINFDGEIVSAIGRNSLTVYMLHQPIILALIFFVLFII